jgi:hypothetical protein
MNNLSLKSFLSAAALFLSCGVLPAQPTTINTVTENFTGKTFAHPGEWEFGRLAYCGDIVPYLTAATGTDSVGSGWLRLTNNQTQQSGYIRYTGTPIKTREADGQGLTIYAAFDFAHWNANSSYPSGGDGCSFFIYDYDVVAANGFSAGAKGGSLGYAQISAFLGGGYNKKASDLAATAVNSSRIDLYWKDNSYQEDGFSLQRSPDGSTWTTLATLAPNSCHYIDTGLTASTTYYYRVAATGSALASIDAGAVGYTASVSARTTAAGTTSGGGGVTVSARIYGNIGDYSGSPYDTVSLVVSGTTIATWTITSGYKVYNATVNSNFRLSNVSLQFTPYNNDNSSPYNHFVIVDYITINGTNYQAESCSNTAYASINSWDHQYNYANGGSNSTMKSEYMVSRQYGGVINYSSYTNSNSIQFSIATPPNAPSGMTATVSGTTVNLGWTDNSNNETGFQIEYTAGSLGGWLPLTTTLANKTSAPVTNLAGGVPYKFRVRAQNGTSYSAASNEATATLPASASGTLLVVRALGTAGTESVTLQLDTDKDGDYTDNETQTFPLSKVFTDNFYFTASTVTPDMVRLTTSAGTSVVESVTIGSTVCLARNCTYNSAASNGLYTDRPFTSFSEWMNRAGYMDFGAYSTGNPQDALGGVMGGYIGVGMDDFGNYSWEGDESSGLTVPDGGTLAERWAKGEGRWGHSDNTDRGAGYTGFSRPAIAVRGDWKGADKVHGYTNAGHAGGAWYNDDYAYLVGTGDRDVEDLEKNMSFPAASSRPTLKADLRRLSLIITPENQLTVFIKFGTGETHAIFTADLKDQVRPANISFGFAAGSGGATDYHEIRNVVVTTFKSLLWTNAKTLVGPGDLNWNTDENWLTGRTPANSTPPYQDVEFDNDVRRSIGADPVGKADASSPDPGRDQENVCLDGAVSIHTITFSAKYPSSTAAHDGIIYRLYGNPLTLNKTTEGASINANAGRHYVDCNIVAQEEFNFNAVYNPKEGAPAILTIRGDVDNGAHKLRLTGLGTVTLLSSTGKLLHGDGGLRIEDAGTFNFFGSVSNTYTGVNTMQEGSAYLKIRGSSSVEDGAGRSMTIDGSSGKYPYVYHDALGTGPIVMSAVDSFTVPDNPASGTTSWDGLDSTTGTSTRETSRIYLNHHNQIENNADVELAGGELHLAGFNESGDDPQ